MAVTTIQVAASGQDRTAFGKDTTYPPAYDFHFDFGNVVVGKSRYSESGSYQYEINTGLLRFPTASLPDGDIITDVKLRIYATARASANNRSLAIDAYDWNGTSSDYSTSAPNSVLKGKPISEIPTGRNVEITLGSTSFINKTGGTSIRLHITGGQPTGNNYINVASFDNTNGHPVAALIITHQAPVIYPASGQGVGSGGRAFVASGDTLYPASGHGVGSSGTVRTYTVPKEAPPAIYGPTRVGAALTRRGGVRMRSRLYLSDVNATKIKELPKVEDATIDLSNYRTATWKLSPQKHVWHGFDPLSDFILATTELWMDGEWHEFPRGLYTFLGHARTHAVTHSMYSSLPGESLEGILAADGPTGAYEVTAGTGILTAVRQILLDRGIPSGKIQFATIVNKTLPTNMVFEATDGGEEETWISIINELLSAGGYYALWTDEVGNFVTARTGDFENREPDLYYSARAYGGDMPEGPYDPLVVEEIEENFEDQNFANRVIARVSDDGAEEGDTLPLTSVMTNRDPNSPASVQNLGRRLGEGKERVITKYVTVRSASTQADLDLIARSQLTRFTSLYHTMSFSTISDPRCGPRQVYQMYISRGGEVINADKWRVVNFTQDLGDKPGATTHNVARHEPFEVGV